MPTRYVALIQQGTVLEQHAIAISNNRQKLQAEADAEAKKLNDAQTGFGESWTAVVLKVG